MAYEKFTIYRGCAQIKNLHCFNKAAADARGIAVWYLNTLKYSGIHFEHLKIHKFTNG